MAETTQESLLLAISAREDLFDMFDEMFTSDNYHKVLMAFEEGMTYAEISDEAGVAKGTVSNAFGELEDFGLVENNDDGRSHTLPVLKHPMIQYYYWNEVVENE